MNPILKYDGYAKHSTRDLKNGYNDKDFSLLDAYLNEKGLPSEIQLPNIFKDHNIIGWIGSTVICYDKWSLSNAL